MTGRPRTPPSGDDFFVGYQNRRSPSQRRFLLISAGASIVGATVFAWALSTSQPAADPGTFEYGTVRQVEATVAVHGGEPLLTAVTALDELPLPFAQDELLAVREGKFGARDLFPRNGERLRLHGTFVHRPGAAMLEIHELAGESRDLFGAAADPPTRSLGQVTLRGEIVDTKCFLGVMKPGRGTMHRACAVRCLSGGVPAGLRVMKPDGSADVLVLIGSSDRTLGVELLDRVGIPVQVTGERLQAGDVALLRTTPADVRRIVD